MELARNDLYTDAYTSSTLQGSQRYGSDLPLEGLPLRHRDRRGAGSCQRLRPKISWKGRSPSDKSTSSTTATSSPQALKTTRSRIRRWCQTGSALLSHSFRKFDTAALFRPPASQASRPFVLDSMIVEKDVGMPAARIEMSDFFSTSSSSTWVKGQRLSRLECRSLYPGTFLPQGDRVRGSLKATAL